VGIEFEDRASGQISSTTVTGSFAAGIQADRKVGIDQVTLFDNNPEFQGYRRR
jgi:hypothetical protein